MRACVNRAISTLQSVGVLIAAETYVFAHGIDERPAPGGGTFILVLSVGWILIALGIVFFIRRLIRRNTAKHEESEGRVNNTKKP